MINPVKDKYGQLNHPDLTPDEEKLYYQVTSKYLTTTTKKNNTIGNYITYTVIANTCIEIDNDLRLLEDDLLKYRKQENQLAVDFVLFVMRQLNNKFTQFDCRNRIEKTRIDSAGNLTTQSAIVSEQNVLPNNYKESNIYIYIGSVVLLTALVIVLTSKK